MPSGDSARLSAGAQHDPQAVFLVGGKTSVHTNHLDRGVHVGGAHVANRAPKKRTPNTFARFRRGRSLQRPGGTRLQRGLDSALILLVARLLWYNAPSNSAPELFGAMGGGSLSDARTGRRFALSLPVKIKKADSERSHAATTNNRSAAGVYITTKLPFREGSKLNFQITLPAPVIGSTNNVEVNCTGRVVRVDISIKGKRRGVACVIDRYQFRPQRKPREAK